MYSFKYNQQDATLYNILYYCQCSTCFGWFLRPSSGAQELYTQHLVVPSLLVATASGSNKPGAQELYTQHLVRTKRRNRPEHVEH
jgi:hypothetical protein